jgi:hypothetical protein
MIANSVMYKMREHSINIVDQATMFATELIRAAILWHEMWYDGLEEASKYYFADGNIPGMFDVLEPLHDMVERVSLAFLGSVLMCRGPRRYERRRLFRALDTTYGSHESIWPNTRCMPTILKFNKLGISTML